MRKRSVIYSLILTILLLAMSGTAASQVQVGVAISVGPPPIPVYEQPICPEDGYIWTPGYWAYDYDDADYYWVPGTWVPAPEVGLLWTPGYWAWGGDGFFFTAGYWGPVVGFYGGINYGFGYFGHGYEGGRWDGGRFYYNTTINRVNVEVVHNVYNTRVTETTVNRVSYNGGSGGINARASAQEEAAARQRHVVPVSAQVQQERTARSDRQQWASVNHGAPAVAATPKPGGFRDSGAVRTREAGGPYKPALRPENNNNARRPENNNPRPENNVSRPENNAARPAIHPNDLPHVDRAAPPNTGNAKLDQRYQQDQQKLQAKQQNDLQKLQQKQEQEHQQMAKQQANQAKQQQMEQRHQQQTQQLQQKHEQQTQQLHQRQQPPPPRENGNKPPHG